MDRSTKAALLSALVFPGAGQLFLKRHGRALVFFVPAAAAALYFSSAVMQPVLAIAHEITSGAMAFDPFLIQQRVEQSRIDTFAMNLAALVMLVTWLSATIDAWIVGRRAPPVAVK